MIDEFVLLVAPCVDGRESARRLFEHGADGLANRVRMRFVSTKPREHGIVEIRYAVEGGTTV